MIACMGGWCSKRDMCGAYLLRQPLLTPIERACAKGEEFPAPLDSSKFPQWFAIEEVKENAI